MGISISSTCDAASLTGSRPNIVVFITDDQDKHDCGRYGGKWLTPRFDRFAEEGIALERFHVASTICSPSRYSLITGRYPDRQYSEDVDIPPNQLLVGNNQGLARTNGVSETTIGTIMKQAGYATGFVGKYHMGGFGNYDDMGLPAQIDIPDTADVYDPQTTADALQNQESMEEYIATHGFDFVESIDWKNAIQPFKDHNLEWLAHGALEFLEQQRTNSAPFYLHFSTTMPHGTPGGWENSLNADMTVTPDGIRNDLTGLMPTRQSVHDRVNAIGYADDRDRKSALGYLWNDDLFGTVLDKLQDIGADTNTVVIWLADHGTTYKSALQALEGTRVPAAIRWPGTIPSNTISHTMLNSVDLAATWFDLAGTTASTNYNLDGQSFADLLDDGQTATPRSDMFLSVGYARAVVRSDGFKYIAFRPTVEMTADIKSAAPEITSFYYTSPRKWGTLWTEHPQYLDYHVLYNLGADPHEGQNLAYDPAHATTLGEMQGIMQSYIDSFTVGHSFGEFRPGGNTIDPSTTNAITQAEWDRGRSILGFAAPAWYADMNTNGLSDAWEAAAGLPAEASAETDSDGDGRSENMEWRLGTDPFVPDTAVHLTIQNGYVVADYKDLFEPTYGASAEVGHTTSLTNGIWNEGIGTPVILDHVTINGMRYRQMRRYLPSTAAAFLRHTATNDVAYPEPPVIEPSSFLVDDFDYSVGTLAGQSGGSGWGGAWSVISNTMQVVSGALTFNSANYSNGVGNARSADDDSSNSILNVKRDFSIPFSTAVWVSFLSNFDPDMHEPAVEMGNNSWQEFLINGLSEDHLTIQASSSNSRAGFYDDLTGDARTGNSTIGSAQFMFPPASTNTFLHIVKFETNVSGNNDRVTWYATSDPADLTSQTTATLADFDSVVGTSLDGDWWGDTLNAIGLEVKSQSSNAEADMSFDNIRIYGGGSSDDAAIQAILSGVVSP